MRPSERFIDNVQQFGGSQVEPPRFVQVGVEPGHFRPKMRDVGTELRAEVARLDADLDESRRLNLRAAELLDIVYETLGRTQGLSE